MGADHAGNRVVDQGVEVLNAGFLEALLVLGVVQVLEGLLEVAVVLLHDGVLGGEPEVLLLGQSILEAGAGKALNGGVLVVGALQNAGALELVDGLALDATVHAGEDQLGLAGLVNAEFGVLIDIAVAVTGNRNGSGPAGDIGLDAGGHNGGAENGAVQNAADGAVGALVHLLQIVLGHALGVGGDGGALDANMILLDGVAGIPGNLVVGCVTVDQTQVVVFGVELDKRIQKLVLDHGPKDSGHFVAVHLNDGVLHFDLFHHKFSFYFRRLEACCQRQV